MKSFVAFFVAAALVTPAFAQNMTLQEMQQKHSVTAVKLAGKPVLLHTGKPISQADKLQIQAAANKSITSLPPGARNAGASHMAAAFPPSKVTITPAQMYVSGYVNTVANQMYVNAELKQYLFEPNPSTLVNSSLQFDINVQPNTTYVLTFKVHTAVNAPKFQLYDDSQYYGPGQSLPSFTGTPGDSEFAYAFVPQSGGQIGIMIFSTNAEWQLVSCEVTATPVN